MARSNGRRGAQTQSARVTVIGAKQPVMSLSSTAYLLFRPIAVLAPLLLTACIEPSTHSEISDTLNKVSFQPPPPAPPGLTNPSGTATTTPPEARLQPQIYEGRPESSRPVAATAQRSGDGVQLNFEQAEIRDVIKVILGDTLG